jgi:menaquinone-9 beta-reductase
VMFDVLIAGGGPAGSIAAVVLARAGARVLVLDRARFPRDKLCGDTVNPGAMAILERLGLAGVTASGLDVDGMIVTGDTGVRCQSTYGVGAQGRALSRRTLDARLLAEAERAGASIDQGVLVQGPLADGNTVRGLIVGSLARPQQLKARIVIAADGSGSRLARAAGLSKHARRPRRWAVGGYFEGVDFDDRARRFGEMHIRHGHYIGIAPLPGHLTNACVVTADRRALRDPASLLRETIRGDVQIRDRFARSRPVSPPVCFGPLAVDNSACGMAGLLLAGDAAGFIDPMTGDGLRFALRGGELAALAALAFSPADAHVALARDRRREFSAKWRFNRALRSLVGSPLAVRLAARGARLSPALIGFAIRYAGDV